MVRGTRVRGRIPVEDVLVESENQYSRGHKGGTDEETRRDYRWNDFSHFSWIRVENG